MWLQCFFLVQQTGGGQESRSVKRQVVPSSLVLSPILCLSTHTYKHLGVPTFPEQKIGRAFDGQADGWDERTDRDWKRANTGCIACMEWGGARWPRKVTGTCNKSDTGICKREVKEKFRYSTNL